MVNFEISLDTSLLKKILVLGILLTVFAFELNVTLSSPIAFGDEGFHVSIARHIGTEVDYPRYVPLFGSELNPETYRRPPLWNIMEGSFYFLFGFSDQIVKVLVPFLSFMTGLVVFVFVRKLYSENAGVIATLIAVTLPSFVTYSLLFYTTVPYVFFFSIAFLSFLTALKTEERKWWVVSGIFSGIAILANIAGAFMLILAVVMGLVYLARNRSMSGLGTAFKTYGMMVLIMTLIVTPWMVRNVGMFAAPGCNPLDLLTGACAEGVDYEIVTENEFVGRTSGGATEGSILSMGVLNYLQFAYGFANPNQTLNLVGALFVPFLFLAGLVVVAKRRKMEDVAILASVLIFFAIFTQVGGFFEGRAEDTSRYFLSAVPVVGLVAALYIASIRKEGSRYNWLILSIVFVVVAALALNSFFIKAPQIGGIKMFVPSFFEACDWVKENTPEDASLLSLNTFPTRFNCERAAVWETPDKADILLSGDVEIVKGRLEANGIDYVFVQKFSLSNQALGQAYPVSFVQLLEDNPDDFERVYENGPRLGSEEFNNCIAVGCDPGNVVYRVK